ncbi:MAG: hypothetical protein ACYTEN_08060 [Planctomycetota bacterium]|jgi:MFS family permease
MEPWFDEKTAGMIGGILGAGLGGVWCGGVLGGMSSFYIKKGLKKLAYGLYGLTFLVGLILAGIGLIGVITDQPYHVWYPFILTGGIVSVVIGGIFPMISKRFAEREKEIMAIEDL